MADEVSKVTISGVKEMRAALKKYDAEMLKALDAEVRAAIKPVIVAAKANVPDKPPMSGWRTIAATNGKTRGGAGWPAWDGAAIQKEIKQRNGKRRRKGRTNSALYTINNFDAAGSIYEVAGRKSTGKGTGAQFINNLNNVGGSASRVIYKALDSVGKIAIAEAIAKAYEDVAARLQTELDFNAPSITTRKK